MTDKEIQQNDSLNERRNDTPPDPESIDPVSEPESINIISESNGVSISPSEKRKNHRLYIAGILAGILWLSLLGVIFYHCSSTFRLSDRLSQLKTEEESSFVKEAVQLNQETAQSIYTFLTPLAAAVTAFFFDANRSDKNED